MALFSIRKLRFLTHLSPRDAGNRIQEHMDLGERPKFWIPRFLRKYTHRYNGNISGKSFSMARNTRYRNGWLPQVEGEIKPGKQYTEVIVEMKPPVYSIAFAVFWTAINAVIAAVMAVIALGDPGMWKLLAIPGILTGGFFLIKSVLFAVEARIVKKDLEKWLEMKAPAGLEMNRLDELPLVTQV